MAIDARSGSRDPWPTGLASARRQHREKPIRAGSTLLQVASARRLIYQVSSKRWPASILFTCRTAAPPPALADLLAGQVHGRASIER
jgi:hypothetical protein